jgi:hypothetical protein
VTPNEQSSIRLNQLLEVSSCSIFSNMSLWWQVGCHLSGSSGMWKPPWLWTVRA